MASVAYLTLDEFRKRTVMPGADVDEVESREPGWIGEQLLTLSARMDGKLSKRYAAPFLSPYPEAALSWLARVTTVRVYLKRGVNPSDAQFDEYKADATAAWTEIDEAANGQTGLWELPLRGDTDQDGIVKGAPMAYSEASPFAGQDVQRDRARVEDQNGIGTYGGRR